MYGAAFALAAVVVLSFMYGERRRFKRAAPGTLMLVRASVGVDALLAAPETAGVLDGSRLGSFSRWNESRASGWITANAAGLDWAPDRVAARWGAKPFHLAPADIVTAEVGSVGAKGLVALHMRSGAVLDFRGTWAEHWRRSLRALGIRLVEA